ncbi:MAG: hypothetical protein PHO30_08030 [Candidatus Omnitrophica bacterium]|nr:hypothetical protein [Candidatus Omnitrophota bacterium]
MALLGMLKGLFKSGEEEAKSAAPKVKKVKKAGKAVAVTKKNTLKTGKKPTAKKAQKIKAPAKAKSAGSRIKPLVAVEETAIGKITHYFGNISVGIIKLKSALTVGDKIHIKGAHADFKQTVTSIQLNHQSIPIAVKGKEVGIKVGKRVHKRDIVYKINE